MSNPNTITVVIPSRTQPKQLAFLSRAVQSIKNQTIYAKCQIDVVVGLDSGQNLPLEFCRRLKIRYVQSGASSQAAALNAAAANVASSFLAFLEDDDQWNPQYLEFAFEGLRQADFVSSTQLEVTEQDAVIRINDFPTPSGWIMKTDLWNLVGDFNAEYRLHLDNEWLGRLGESRAKRIHMVESTAPVDVMVMAQVRPWLATLVEAGGAVDRIAFLRHKLPVPLVRRLNHIGSGMAKIAAEPEMKQRSLLEKEALIAKFQRIPW